MSEHERQKDGKRPLLVRWLGTVPYAEALTMQEALVAARRRGEASDQLLLLEHPPVITLGRGSDRAHVLLTREELRERGVELHETGRGGDVTYHGPGQLVGYPILAIPRERRDAHRYLRDLEQILIRAVAHYGIEAGRIEGLTGIWVGQEKIAAVGVRLGTGWITSHGFALNVNLDLEGFEAIVPCGIRDRGVTSMARLCPEAPLPREVAARTALELAAAFGLDPVAPDDPDERLALPGAPGLSSSP